jgi:hypothetical protein
MIKIHYLARMSYLRKPFEGEAGMVPLSRGERSLKSEQAFLAGEKL